MNQIARFRVNSTLTGGQITSTQAAIDNNQNRYDAQGGTSPATYTTARALKPRV